MRTFAGKSDKFSIAELCRKEGIAQGHYYSWSKEFLEAGMKRLAGGGVIQGGSLLNPQFRQSLA